MSISNGFANRPGRKPSALTEAMVVDARQRIARGERNASQLAQEAGVDSYLLRQAVRGDTWRHLDDIAPPVRQDTPGQRHQKLSRTQVIDARRRVRAGESFMAIAREFQVSAQGITRAVRGLTWRQLDNVEPPVPPEPSTPGLPRSRRLSAVTVAEARTRYSAGTPQSVLARDYDVVSVARNLLVTRDHTASDTDPKSHQAAVTALFLR